MITNLGQRNPNFVGRENLRQEMDRLLPVILSGAGGVGKSKLAIDFAYRPIDRYDLIWFVSAEDGFGAREMLVELGGRLRIPPATIASAPF